MFDQLLGAAISSFSPQCLLFNIIGVVIGIVFGAFPGLNGVVGIALLMPLTYGTDPVVGITCLLYTSSDGYDMVFSRLQVDCGTGEPENKE